MQGKALWYVGPGRAELREEKIAASKPGEVRVRALFGAISRGTERLVRAGRVPASEYDRMRAPFMGGTFPFPVKYGYATVGQVEAGPAELKGRIVFSLHPHQSLFTVPVDAVFAIPAEVPPRRAVLAPNMETALNGVWDGAPGPADRIAEPEARQVRRMVLRQRRLQANVASARAADVASEEAADRGAKLSKAGWAACGLPRQSAA